MPKKRSRDEEDIENDSEEDPYEDEEDEEEPRRKKGSKRKKKKQKNSLIDFEAEEDDAEDEDEEDDLAEPGIVPDDDIEEAELSREREQTRRQRLDHARAMSNENHEELQRFVKERYENAMDDDVGAPDTSGIDQQSLLPTIRDPRLYMVRCTKPGYERKAIFSLLQKKFNLQRKNIELGIISAVAPEHLKGRIYIEAHSAAQVQLAVNGLRLFSTTSMKMVDVDEMPDVLKLGKRPDKQVNGNWVRIKRKDSVYFGDLAQVCNVREGMNEGFVTIRLIPRLDLKSEKDLIENRDENFDNDSAGTRRRGRPPQMLFDRKELYRLTGSSDVVSQRNRDTGEIFEVWNDKMYRFGLLYMPRVSIKSLHVGDAVQPTVEELETWIVAEKHMRMMYEDDPQSMDADVAARGLELDVNSVAGRRRTKLSKGDSVRVTHGEQKGLEGKIESINQDVVMVRIPEITEPVLVNRAHINKTFKVGEHVKVSSGKYAGNTGAIVGVEGDFLTIFSDTTREEIKVLSAQVADSADVNVEVASSTGAAQPGMRYELFDLVQMVSDPNDKGVIIQVQNDTLTVLTPQNTRKVVNVSAVKGKIRDDSVRALDARRNPIAPNDTVHVTYGPMQNRTGVVKHVAGRIIYFKVRDEVNNCGLLAVLASQCTASTAAARRLTSTISGNPTAKNPTPIPRGAVGMYASGGRRGGRGGGPGGGGHHRDPLLRKEVKVTSGQYKGYTGRVVDANDKTVRVELTSRMKMVSLQRNRVKEVGAVSDKSSNFSSNGTSSSISRFGANRGGHGSSLNSGGDRPYQASQTPRPDAYSHTPRPDRSGYGSSIYSGSATPRGPGSATPRAYGMHAQTPSHIPNGMQTPSSNDFNPIMSHTPGRNFGSFTPAGSAGTSGFGTTQPTTPVAEGNPYSSLMPHTPSTPAAQPVPITPMTPGLNSNSGSLGGAGSNGASNNVTDTYGGGMEPRTPGMVEPTTPGYPGMEPRTPAPGGLEPATPAPPMEPHTPAPGGLEPHTPGPGMEPSTPMVQEPQTPHTPAVPHTPHPQEEDTAELGYRVLVDVEVLVTSMNNSAAKVINAATDGSIVRVRMLTGDTKGEEIEIPLSEITPVQPRPEVGEVQELVKVLDGDFAGQTGRLQSVQTGLDDMEGLVRFSDGQEAMLNMSLVAKCSEE